MNTIVKYLILLLNILNVLGDNDVTLKDPAIILKGVTLKNNWPYEVQINGKYEGYVIDVMNDIANNVGFEYKLYSLSEGQYGSVHESKIDGMVGEVYNKRADFAIADLTVTDVRKKYVDFTEAIMETSIAVLIHKNYSKNIETLTDLVNQTDIEYGIYGIGATYNLFAISTDPTINQMYLHMSENPQVLINSAKEGLERVMKSRFAFIVESSFAEFFSGIYCDLTYIEDKNNHFPRQYAIAMPKNSIYTSKFSSAIRKLRQNGQLYQLKTKYWNKKCEDNMNKFVYNSDNSSNTSVV